MVYKNPKFDLNKIPADFAFNDEFGKDDDTALRLECVGHGTISQQDAKSAPDDGSGLILGLGRTPSVCFNELDLLLKLGLCSSTSKSDLNPISNHHHHVLDEGSTSAKSSGGYMPSLLLAPRISVPLQKLKISEPEPSVVSDSLRETASDQQTSNKRCEFSRCANGQAGYCLPNGCGVWRSHSTGCSQATSGKRGVVAGCSRNSGTNSCAVHKGGKRPVAPWHTKSTCGSTSFYGGGKRFKFKNHTMLANDSTDVCNSHGGFHGLVSDAGPSSPDNHSLLCTSTVSNSTSWLGKPTKRQNLIPPQVLVPSSMKLSLFLPFTKQPNSGTHNNGGHKTLEGRVHGGSLLRYVGGNL